MSFVSLYPMFSNFRPSAPPAPRTAAEAANMYINGGSGAASAAAAASPSQSYDVEVSVQRGATAGARGMADVSVLRHRTTASSATSGADWREEYNEVLMKAVFDENENFVKRALTRKGLTLEEDHIKRLFQIAVEHNKSKIVRLLLSHAIYPANAAWYTSSHEIDANAAFVSTGLTPLETAIRRGYVETVATLLGRSLDNNYIEPSFANVNRRASNNTYSPLHVAVSRLSDTIPLAHILDIIELLNEAGADFKLVTANGRTVLDIAGAD